jgi:hypothetical protein
MHKYIFHSGAISKAVVPTPQEKAMSGTAHRIVVFGPNMVGSTLGLTNPLDSQGTAGPTYDDDGSEAM